MSRTGPRPTRPHEGAPASPRRLPPPLPHPCLARPRLVAAAREGLSAGLLRVVAGAGYGKTTLLAQAVAGLGGPLAWISCDPRPGRPSPVDALVAALAAELPGLTAPPRRSRPEDRAAALSEQLAAHDHGEVLLVVDDAHLLAEGRGARELAALAHELRAPARLAIASRETLPPSLGGARADAVTLDEGALSLSAEDAGELLAALGADASAEEAAERAHECEGWMTGFVLSARPGGDPLEYLLREVVDPLPEPAARLLEDLSHLDRFTDELAARVGEREDAGELLGLVEERRAFLAPAPGGPGWRRHHRMLRAALQRRAAERPAAHAAELHRRAAAAWNALGEPEAAARHHVAAGDLSSAVAALAASRGGDGEHRPPVEDWLRAIPPGAWSDAPGPVLAQASQLFYRSDHLGAFSAMESAARELLARGDSERAAVVLVRLLRAAPLAGGLYDRTIAVARELVPRLGAHADLQLSARVMLALLLGESCRYAEAEHELAAALDAAGGDPLIDAYATATRAFAIDHPQGRRSQAMSALNAAIPRLEAAAGHDPLNYLLYARAFRSMILADAGRFVEALDEADRVGAAAADRGMVRLSAPIVAMLRFVPLAGLGHLERLGDEIARSAPTFRRLGGALRGYRHDVAAAALAAATGDRTGVARAAQAAREGLAEHGLPYDGSMALADLALSAATADMPDTARSLADEARALAERAAAPWALARAAIVAAAVLGPGEDGDAALEDALRRSADHRLDPLWSRRERALAAVLLPRALARGVGPREIVVRLVRVCGGEVLAACAEGAAGAPSEVRLALAEAATGAVAADRALDRLLHDPDEAVRTAARRARAARRRTGAGEAVRLVTLGGFAVERGGRRVPDAEFGRQKARVLLAVLACARGPVHREELAAILWPDLAERRAIAALHSTLYTLRRALEPHLSARDASTMVVAEGATYRLVLGPHASWDADEFLRAAGAALAAPPAEGVTALLDSESRYTGALLPEWAFAPWTEPLRTELEETHRAVLVAVAERLVLAGRTGEAISRYRLLLAVEPEREGWHRALMRTYAAAGERALALRQFHSCRTILRERLGVAPSRETRELLTSILREG